MRTSDHTAPRCIENSGESIRDRTQAIMITAALTLMVVVLWLITHRYRGIDNDAQLYAFQALKRIHPALGADLYLQNTSQDNFTVFSPFYCATIQLLGLENATLVLTVLFSMAFLVASWILVRDLVSRNVAWLAVCALTMIPGAYGAAGIFHFSDKYLTPRLPAQALVAISLICFFRGSRLLGLIIAIAALFIHPLMALPGLLLLICLWLPSRARIMGCIAGISALLAMAAAVLAWPSIAQKLGLMDVAWLEVVRERSHFLFLQLWTLSDWTLNARPFICLTITLLVVDDERVRRLSMGALLVGAAGLAVAFIASIAPIAILIQGQAWRWVWITNFVSILLLAPTVLQVWRDQRCGPICAILLITGWTWPVLDGTTCVAVALFLWLIRAHITERPALYLRWTAYAIGAIVVCWALGNAWTIFTSSPAESGREPLLLGRIRNVVGLDIPAVLIVGFLWHWILVNRSLAATSTVAAILLASAVYILPKSFNQMAFAGSPAQIAEFTDWRAAIPETSNVLLADKYDPGSFVWFTLGRPNYLSVDQSAGVVFSRNTALEVKRRSENLLTLMDQDWKMLTMVRSRRADGQKNGSLPYRPLTAQKLVDVCGDPQLGFVIAHEDVGFSPLRHTHAGMWKDWNLYDCSTVRAKAPRA